MADYVDTWLFLAVARSGGTSLEEFIAMADAVNHSVPVYEEVSASLSRLAAAGLIVVHDAVPSLTARGEALFTSVGGFDQPCIAQVGTASQQVRGVLATTPVGPTQEYVTRQRYEVALASYINRTPQWR